MGQQQALHAPDRPGEGNERVEHVDTGSGHPAGRRLLGGVAPFRKSAGDLVAEMGFEVQDLAELALGQA